MKLRQTYHNVFVVVRKPHASTQSPIIRLITYTYSVMSSCKVKLRDLWSKLKVTLCTAHFSERYIIRCIIFNLKKAGLLFIVEASEAREERKRAI